MKSRAAGRRYAIHSSFGMLVLCAVAAACLARTATALDSTPANKSASGLVKAGTISRRDAAESPAKTPNKGRVAGGKPAANSPQRVLLAQAPTEKPEKQDEKPMTPYPFPGSKAAPSLAGGVNWINTAGPIDLADLRGKFVVLDFWTYCCINCMHILPELKKLERAYPNEVVVIGVHSAKFDTEQESENIREAVERYEIEHPVVNDANHAIWDRFGVQSWPTIGIIDPEGKLVVLDSGEIPFEAFDGFLKKALPYYRENKLLDPSPLHFDLEAMKAKQTPLRYPGKLLADENGDRLIISDSNHNRIVVTSLAGELRDVIGSGELGKADGDFKTAQFDHPQGLALVGDSLYVADTENHLLRRVDLTNKQVTTVAGTGVQSRGWYHDLTPPEWSGDALNVALNSPWDLWPHDGWLYIAMAGTHQIWRLNLADNKLQLYAGNGREDIVDGDLLPEEPYAEGTSSFAQPSGLTGDVNWLYVADSEGSSIRAVPFDSKSEVKTIVGTSHLRVARLFTFGDVDGKSPDARLQHAIGVALHDGKLYVADTYNHKIKVVDPQAQTSMTLVGDGKSGGTDQPAEFHEPCGLAIAGEKLYVADTNNHAIRVVDLAKGNQVSTLEIAGLAPPEARPAAPRANFAGARQLKVDAVAVKPVDGHVTLQLDAALSLGYKVNPLAPLVYQVEAIGDAGPLDPQALGKLSKVDEPKLPLEIKLPVTGDTGEATLRVSLNYYYCASDPGGLCKMASVQWTVPVRVDGAAKTSVAKLNAPMD